MLGYGPTRRPEHGQLELGLAPIDLVVVNLIPLPLPPRPDVTLAEAVKTSIS